MSLSQVEIGPLWRCVLMLPTFFNCCYLKPYSFACNTESAYTEARNFLYYYYYYYLGYQLMWCKPIIDCNKLHLPLFPYKKLCTFKCSLHLTVKSFLVFLKEHANLLFFSFYWWNSFSWTHRCFLYIQILYSLSSRRNRGAMQRSNSWCNSGTQVPVSVAYRFIAQNLI